MIKSKFLIYLLTGLLFCTAVFCSVKEASDERPLYAVVSGETQTEELSLVYDGHYGIVYIFLPSYATMDQVQLKTVHDGAYEIGGYPVCDGMRCDVFKLDEPYSIRTSGDYPYDEKELRFVRSGNVSTMFLDVRSGNMDYLHENKQHSESGRIRLYDPSGSLLYNGNADSVSGRGQSSWLEAKKSYNITLQQEADLLMLGTAQRWVLLANAKDPSNLRNKIIMDLANQAGIVYTPDSQWVDLYLNGEYAGLYLLCEKIEIHPQRVDIPSSGSFLVTKDGSWRFAEQAEPYFVTDNHTALGIHYADISQNALESIWQSVENAILAEDGIDPVTGKSWDELIDAESWARKYLLEELFGNTDALDYSQYYYLDSSRPDGKISAGPAWDYDLTMRGEYNELHANRKGFYGASWIPALCEKPEFRQLIRAEYRRLFQPLITALADEGIFRYADGIASASRMNGLRWRMGTDDDYSADLSRYLKTRVAFFDGVWLEEIPHITVRFFGYGNDCTDLCYPAGSLITDLPDYSHIDGITSLGWYYGESDVPFDPDVPVYEDITLRLGYETIPADPSGQSPEDWAEPLPRSRFLAVLVFLMMLVILSAADFVCCSRNPSQKRKAVQTHNSEEIYEAP